MYGAKPHQHLAAQSLHHTGRGGKKPPAGGQGERRRIDIPILPCLLHWPPTLSHIIAADTEKTNDSHVGNMGPGGGGREGVMKGRCEADGTQDVLYVRYTSADSDDVFSRLVLREKKKVKVTGKDCDCAEITGGREIACETRLKSARPRNEKTNRRNRTRRMSLSAVCQR